MSVRITQARHRSVRRPLTPLTDLATAATGSIAVVGRRTAAAAAASGVMVSILASTANAAPADGAAGSVDTAALAASARAVLETSPVVTSPQDASWSFETVSATAVVPEPEPVVVTTRTTTAASRSEARTEAPAVANNPVPQSVSGNAVLEIAARYVGTPYVSGGSTPDGFDCSGFVSYVYAQLGIDLPRTSGAISGVGTVVSAADAQPGDIMWSPGHVSIYAGNGQQIDAPRPGKSVQFRSIWQSSPTYIRIG